MPRVTVLVSNDLEFDQRVAKVCDWLQANDHSVLLVGRLLPGSKPLSRTYRCRRLRIPVYSGALFYALLNIRLFFFLLTARTDIILANDLDTLPAAFLAGRLRRKRIVYDSHEYFTGAEGLTARPFQRKIWEAFERFILPRLDQMLTVNESIAQTYRNAYGIPVYVMRNVPVWEEEGSFPSREQLNLPANRSILILQGAYIDPDRGGRELVEAMEWLPECFLLIIGSGRDIPVIMKIIEQRNFADRIRRLPRIPRNELRAYTHHADLGLTLDKPIHLNYKYSLPNKLFDYIHAGIPVLASDLPELRRIVKGYDVGRLITDIEPSSIANAVREMLASPRRAEWKANALKAARELCWQKESDVLYQVFPSFRK